MPGITGHALPVPDTRSHASGVAADTARIGRQGRQAVAARDAQFATCGAERDLRSPVADDNRREVPRFLESRARSAETRKVRKRVCAPFAAQTCVAR